MQNEKEIYFFLPGCTHCIGSSAIQRFSLNNVNCCNLRVGAITINLPEDMTTAPPIDEILLQAMPLSSSDSTSANCIWNLKDSIFATVDSAGPIYYCSPGINIMQKVKGVFNMWGGEGIPKQYTQNQSDFFYSTDPQRNKPMIAFMGYNDEVFWYPQIKQKVYFSPDLYPYYNSDTFCLVDTPYTLDPTSSTFDLIMGSAINFYRILKALGKAVELHLDCQMGHGLDPDSNFYSDFGTGLTNSELVNKYMVQRICCYFQAEMNGLLGSLKGTDKFVECENYRVKCDTLANNHNCTQTQHCQ